MGEPFIGSEAVAAGIASDSQLRRHFTRVFRDVYVSQGTELTPALRSRGAWLWSRRRGIIAGFSAAALHGSKWVDTARPVDIIHDNRHSPPGLQIWGDRLESDEFDLMDGVPVTTAARSARSGLLVSNYRRGRRSRCSGASDRPQDGRRGTAGDSIPGTSRT
jgi:hypothetical protein